MARPLNDLTGQRFGRLVVERYIPDRRHKGGEEGGWIVLCDCGSRRKVRAYLLTTRKQTSCGCLSREKASARMRTHGKTDTFEFRVWMAMRKRCGYPKHPKYHLYGGRGIAVCARWSDFSSFLADMGECPFEGGSIERLDNDKGYEPSNCVWLPKSEQSKNRRTKKVTGHAAQS